MLGVTLLLTFSRGPIFACGVGLATYLVLGRPRSLLSAGLVVVPTVAISVIAAYRATSLTVIVNGSAVQASEGHHVATVVGVCTLVAGVGRFVLAGIDPYVLRLGAGRPAVSRERRPRRVGRERASSRSSSRSRSACRAW